MNAENPVWRGAPGSSGKLGCETVGKFLPFCLFLFLNFSKEHVLFVYSKKNKKPKNERDVWI